MISKTRSQAFRVNALSTLVFPGVFFPLRQILNDLTAGKYTNGKHELNLCYYLITKYIERCCVNC